MTGACLIWLAEQLGRQEAFTSIVCHLARLGVARRLTTAKRRNAPPLRRPQIRQEEDETHERHNKAFDDMVAAAKANPPAPHDPMRFRAVPPGGVPRVAGVMAVGQVGPAAGGAACLLL